MSEWDVLEETAKLIDESFSDLFTYYEYYLLANNPKRSLYEEIKGQIKGDSNEAIHDFHKFVDCLVETDSPELKRIIYTCKYLPNQIFWKAIMATAKKESFPEYFDLCELIRNLYYSYWIAGYTTSKTKQLSFNLIKWIKDGKTFDFIRESIYKKYESDRVVKNMLENLQDDAYGKGWLKPLLICIEYYEKDDSVSEFIELKRNIQADHILPKEWEKFQEWEMDWDTISSDQWLAKIGNLTLLSGRKNIQASNSPFEKKLAIYKGTGLDGITSFVISQDILKKPKWTPQYVEERQEKLFKRVKQLLLVDSTT